MSNPILLLVIFILAISATGRSYSSENVVFKPSSKYGSAFSSYRSEAGDNMLSAFTKTPAGTLKIVFQECGMINAFYSSSNRSITVCYELEHAISSAIRNGNKNISMERQVGLEAGAFLFIFFHEFGHAVIDMAKLPILGGEEDAADRFATTILLDAPRTINTGLAKEVIEGGLTFFGAKRKPGILGAFKKRNYADEHPLNEQRVFNILCLAYGNDPNTFTDLVVAQNMPKARLVRCGEEYRDAKHAIGELLKAKSAYPETNSINNVTSDEYVIDKIRRGVFNPGDGAIRAPDVVSEGSITPVEISLNTPLTQNDCLYIIVDDLYISHKICPRGGMQVQLASLRIKLPATGRIIAAVAKSTGDISLLYRQVQVTGYKPEDFIPPSVLRMKNKAQRLGVATDIKMMINSAMTKEDFVQQVNYTFDSTDKIDVYMTPWASKNPYVGIKAVNSDRYQSYSVTIIGNSGSQISETVVVQ